MRMIWKPYAELLFVIRCLVGDLPCYFLLLLLLLSLPPSPLLPFIYLPSSSSWSPACELTTIISLSTCLSLCLSLSLSFSEQVNPLQIPSLPSSSSSSFLAAPSLSSLNLLPPSLPFIYLPSSSSWSPACELTTTILSLSACLSLFLNRWTPLKFLLTLLLLPPSPPPCSSKSVCGDGYKCFN